MLDQSIIEAGKALRIWNGGMMRRRYQAGHLFQRGKRKVWVARWCEPILDNGKIRTVLRSRVIGLCEQVSKSAARSVLEGWLRPLNEGIYQPTETATFDQFFEKWERDLLPSYRESTRGFYQNTARRWILPYFTGWKIGEIRPEDIQRYINLFGQKYSNSAIRHVRATLNCLFTTAVTWRYLKTNPATGLKLPTGKPVRRAAVLKPAEIARLIAYLREPYRTMVLVATTSGMRESELLALRWEDFDWENHTILIRRRIYRAKVDELKTGASYRVIPLQIAAEMAIKRLAGSTLHRGEYVFTSTKGGIYRPSTILRKVFKPAADALGLTRFSWRSFRRSAESAMHNAGVPLKAQQAVLGHAHPNMTLLYAETDEPGKRAAIDKLGELIFPNLSHVATAIATEFLN